MFMITYHHNGSHFDSYAIKTFKLSQIIKMLLEIVRNFLDSLNIIQYSPFREKVTLQQDIEQTEETIRKRKTEIEVRANSCC